MSSTLQNGSFYGGVRAERTVAGLTLAETGYVPGFVVPPHDHAHPFFCLGLRGTFAERMERQTWTAVPATVFFHPAGAQHAEEFGEVGGRLFNIQLGRSWLGRLQPFEVRPPGRQMRSTGGALTRIALDVLHEFRRADTASDLAIDGLVLAMMAHLSRIETPAERSGAPAWLDRVREMLHDRAHQPMDIAGIAAEVDIHPVHLARVFRDHHGCSPGEYLRRVRVEHACTMLADTPRTLAQVAYSSGYADQSHFTRQFKRAVGVTPGEYRRLVGR